MNYKIGDTVVHWTHGIGSVIAIEEVQLAGTAQWCYVVEVGILKLWVAVDDACKGSIRFPMERSQFQGMLAILRQPGQPLPERYTQRKMALRARMQKRTLAELCQVIRDLTERSRHHTLTADDASDLSSAEEHLLDEWVISLSTERAEAQRELEMLLQYDSSGIRD